MNLHQHAPRVLLFGRANVGKSTLFNKLIGRAQAIVYDEPGVTRDIKEHPCTLVGTDFILMDAAGYETSKKSELSENIQALIKRATERADIILFVVDGREGVHNLDQQAARWLRKNAGNKPIRLLANKCESQKGLARLDEFYQLGIGEPIPVSAEHAIGFSDIHSILLEEAPAKAPSIENSTPEQESDTDKEEQKELSITIIGRPNVGKSTLVNALLEDQRMLTGDMPGITRDSVQIGWNYNGREIKLVDTAGIRRKSRITDDLERLSIKSSLHNIRFAEVVVLLLDATQPLEKQELTLAEHTLNEGRALVLALNKWDLVPLEEQQPLLNHLHRRISHVLPQVKGVPCITLSAKDASGLEKLMQTILIMEEKWNMRLSTGKLNRWLKAVVNENPPPLVKGKSFNIKYIAQINKRPPSFTLYTSKSGKLPDSYIRYLVNSLRETFDLSGTPIRMMTRSAKNPYQDEED